MTQTFQMDVKIPLLSIQIMFEPNPVKSILWVYSHSIAISMIITITVTAITTAIIIIFASDPLSAWGDGERAARSTTRPRHLVNIWGYTHALDRLPVATGVCKLLNRSRVTKYSA